jgi:CO/xanthine dehydrogenase Mo-binding subunit
VIAVYTADDLGAYWQPGPLLVPPPPIPGITFNQRTQVPLAKDKVRHVGEPLALVIAQSRHLAEDALADIAFDLEPLPAVTDLELHCGRNRPACTTTYAATSPRTCARPRAATIAWPRAAPIA